MNNFINDIITESGLKLDKIETTKTPNGYAVVIKHGFDTRKLMDKWGSDVELKRDDMLFVSSIKKD